jgi:DNA polymerase
MLAARCGQERGLFFNLQWDRLPQWFRDAFADPDLELHAHNASFERLCCREIMARDYGWPKVRGNRWRCSAARARRLALPGKLEKLGPPLNIADHLLKDTEGHKIMLRISKPLPKRKNSPPGIQWDDDPAKLLRVGEYCLQDVDAEEACESRMLPMTEEDWEDYHFTERLNDRGVKIDVGLVRRLVWRAVEASEELDREIRERTGGAVQRVTNVAQLKQWVYDETGVVLETLRKEDMDDLVGEANRRGLPKHVVRVLKLRQEGGKSSNSKLLKALARVSRDGRLRGEFVYHGASTGRYTSMGVQLQNLIRDCLKDFDREIAELDTFTLTQITLAIRGCFIPDAGHVFVDADYNAIEARGVAWLAGCKKLVRIFAEDGDPYCEMASVIYRFAVTAQNEWERFVGKQTILGCGYGMGAQKFYDQCVKFGKPVDMETAERSVSAYREEYWEIPELWRDMERAAVAAVKEPGRSFSIPNGLVTFRVAHGYLQMRLPSGRRLFYKDPLIIRRKKFGRMQDTLTFMGIHPKTKQWARETTWGGTLTENAVQAIARDLLFRAMKRLDREQIPIVLSVHDQVISEVRVEDGPWAVKRVKTAMEDCPVWARGFPIKTTPKIAMRFGK